MFNWVKQQIKLISLVVLVILTLTTCTLTGTIQWNLGAAQNVSSATSSSVVSSTQSVIASSSVQSAPFLITISIETRPSRLEFTPSEAIDPTGGTIRVYLSNGSSSIVPIERSMISATSSNLSTLGTKTVEVFYTLNGIVKSTSYEVRIVPVIIPLTSLALNVTSTTLTVGQSLKINTVLTPVNTTVSDFIWTSSNPTAIFVSREGLVTALAAGSSIITVTGGGRTITATITAVNPVINTPAPSTIVQNVITYEEYIYSGYLPIASAEQLNQIRYYNEPFEATFGVDNEITVIFEDDAALKGNYVLFSNIDFSLLDPVVDDWYDLTLGWQPIGDSSYEFSGIFDGNFYFIENLFINRPSEDNVGLFGYATGSIKNLGLFRQFDSGVVDIKGQDYVGVLVGYALDGIDIRGISISNYDVLGRSYVSVVVGGIGEEQITNNPVYIFQDLDLQFNSLIGLDDIGFVAGDLSGNIVFDNLSISNNKITGARNIGGLVGYLSDGYVNILNVSISDNILEIRPRLTDDLNDGTALEVNYERVGHLFGTLIGSQYSRSFVSIMDLSLSGTTIFVPQLVDGTTRLNVEQQLIRVRDVGGLAGYTRYTNIEIFNSYLSAQIVTYLSSLQFNARYIGGLFGRFNDSFANIVYSGIDTYISIPFVSNSQTQEFVGTIREVGGLIGSATDSSFSINNLYDEDEEEINTLVEIFAITDLDNGQTLYVPKLYNSFIEQIGGLFGLFEDDDDTIDNLSLNDLEVNSSVLINSTIGLINNTASFDMSRVEISQIGQIIGEIDNYVVVTSKNAIFDGFSNNGTTYPMVRIIEQNFDRVTETNYRNTIDDIASFAGEIDSASDVYLSGLEFWEPSGTNGIEILTYSPNGVPAALVHSVGILSGDSTSNDIRVDDTDVYASIEIKANQGSSAQPTGYSIGGLFGKFNSDSALIHNVNYNGYIFAPSLYDVGGFIGIVDGHSEIFISSAYAANDIDSNKKITGLKNVGGFIGNVLHANVTLNQVTNAFNLEATSTLDSNIGGLIGFIDMYTDNFYLDPVTNPTVRIIDSANGLTFAYGVEYGDVLDIPANYGLRANISALSNNVGGLVGLHENGDLIIEFSLNRGSVTTTGTNVGGLVGKSQDRLIIKYSFSNATITGDDYVGGLVGNIVLSDLLDLTLITDSYAAGTLVKAGINPVFVGGDKVGGIVGQDGGFSSIYRDNYYLNTLASGSGTAQTGNLSRTDAQLTDWDSNTFTFYPDLTNWPVLLIWVQDPRYVANNPSRDWNDGYPMLFRFYQKRMN